VASRSETMPRRAAMLALRLVLMIGGAAVLATAYYHPSSLFAKSYDQVNSFLAGLDLLKGNWRLKGWVLTPPDFWTSDIALSALLAAIAPAFGLPPTSPALLILQPAITWSITVVLSVCVVASRVRGRRAMLTGVLIVLAVLGVPLLRPGILWLILLSAIHIGSVLYGIAAFHCFDRAFGAPRGSSLPSLVAGAVLLALGVIGDPLVIPVGVLPVLLTAWARGAAPTRVRAHVATAALIAAAAAEAGLYLNWKTGGFQTLTLVAGFVDLDRLGLNALTIVSATLTLFGANVFGRPLADSIPELLHLPLLLAAVIAAAAALWRLLPARWPYPTATEPSPLVLMLSFGAALDILALLLSDRVEIQGAPIAAGRYLFPLLVYGAILAGITFAASRRLLLVAILAIGAAARVDLPLYGKPGTGLLTDPQAELVGFLQAHHLSVGIGSYFDSTVLGFAVGGDFAAYPGIADSSGRIVPFYQLRKPFSFPDLSHRDFFVVVSPPEAQTFTDRDVIATFGPPAEQYRLAGFGLYAYRHAAE